MYDFVIKSAQMWDAHVTGQARDAFRVQVMIEGTQNIPSQYKNIEYYWLDHIGRKCNSYET